MMIIQICHPSPLVVSYPICTYEFWIHPKQFHIPKYVAEKHTGCSIVLISPTCRNTIECCVGMPSDV